YPRGGHGRCRFCWRLRLSLLRTNVHKLLRVRIHQKQTKKTNAPRRPMEANAPVAAAAPGWWARAASTPPHISCSHAGAAAAAAAVAAAAAAGLVERDGL